MWMVGQLGIDSINAVGLSNRLFFLFILLVFGVNSGSAIFFGQYWGKGEISGIHKVLGISFITNMLLSSIFASVAIFAPRWFLGILTQNPDVIELGVGYLRILAASFFLSAFSLSLVAVLRAVRQVKIPMLASFIGLLFKLGINYLIIFVFDFGIVGAAWGTIGARIIEISIQIWMIKRFRLPIFASIREHFAFDMAYVRNFFKTTLPVILNEGIWALGIFIYEIFYQFAGHYSQSAVQISENVGHMFLMLGFAIGHASGIIVANTLGAGDKELTISSSNKSLVIGGIIAVFIGILLFFAAPPILSTYNVPPDVARMATNNLRIVSSMAVFRILNFFFIVGILRNGGDTLYCMFVDVLCVWLIGIPMAFLGTIVLGLPIYIVVAMVHMEEVIKFFVNLYRYKKGNWAKKLV